MTWWEEPAMLTLSAPLDGCKNKIYIDIDIDIYTYIYIYMICVYVCVCIDTAGQA